GRDAWRSHVQESLHERARLAGSIAGISAGGSPSHIATEVASMLVRLPGVSAATVVSVAPDGSARFLAGLDHNAVAVRQPGQSVEPRAAAELRQVLASGAGFLNGESGCDLVGEAPGAAVVAGLTGASGTTSAALALGTTPGRDRTDDLRGILSSAIDLAPVVERVLMPSLESGDRAAALGDLRAIIAETAFHPVYQPIVDLSSGEVLGYEALTRFADGARPDLRFNEATRLGLGIELELATLHAAVADAVRLAPDRYLSVNVSAELLTRHDLTSVIELVGVRPLVLELTEHERVDDYELVREALARLGPGVRMSVDDAGSGWASLRHVLALRPHFVKVDRGWISAIDTDPARQALLSGISGFAETFGGLVVAEGIETADELDALRHMGIHLGQGYHLGRPAPIGQHVDG
ncbi:MAG: EAL domain-containing protein, partial [Acidimicrobiales bacterium]